MLCKMPSLQQSPKIMMMSTTECVRDIQVGISHCQMTLKNRWITAIFMLKWIQYLAYPLKTDITSNLQSDTTEMQFRIWNLQVDIENAPLATSDREGDRFQVDSSIMLEVPVSFGGKLLPPMRIKVKNSAGYTPKF